MCRKMCRKMICLVSFVLVLAFLASQVGAAPMGTDGYADRVKICDDGNGNAIWYADASGPSGFGDGIAEVSGVFGEVNDVHMLGDVSGDGIVDRVVARVIGADNFWTWMADYSTPTGFGDGVADTQCGLGSPEMAPHAVVDLDGDAIADRVIVAANCLYYGDKGATGGGFGGEAVEWESYFGDPSRAPIGMADLNGDGLADRVVNWFPATAMYFVADLALASGGFGDGNLEEDWTGAFGAAGMWSFVGDLNADGCGDRAVAYEIAGNTYTWVGTLSGFGGDDSVSEEEPFGTPGDILLLSDVLDIE